tara:strand:+ start:240 stop:599 length:360 start_codon:yes stop_codon:yes gene_type:complete
MVNRILDYKLEICIEDKNTHNIEDIDITRNLPDHLNILINKFLNEIDCTWLQNDKIEDYFKNVNDLKDEIKNKLILNKENSTKEYIVNQVRVILDANENNKDCDKWDLKDHIELILKEL